MATPSPVPVTKYQWELLSNSPVANSRTDDIWFFDELTGWLVNSSGYVAKTEDGGNNWTPKFFLAPNLPSFPYLRCMSWANRQIGWFGAVTGIGDVDSITSPSQYIRILLHHTTDGGETWRPVENLPEGSPAGICGFHAVNERVAYGSGTNDPGLPGPAIIKTKDNGEHWELIDMRKHASNLIDIYFFDEDNGFVVGGLNDEHCKIDQKAYPPPRLSRYGKVKPVILRTNDGGKSWTNTVANIKEFECGEWGWKIQFLNKTHGFVALENFRNASILVTKDGGNSWVKKHVAKNQDPGSRAINNDLEGIGFINEREGWVGGWGFQDLSAAVGGLENSFTQDGGNTWIPQNHLPDPDTTIPNDPRYRINRYRFVKDIAGNVVSGYCSGQQVFKMTIGSKKRALAARTMGLTAAFKRVEPANSTQGSTTPAPGGPKESAFAQVKATEAGEAFALTQVPNEDGTVQISYTLPEDTENVFLGLWNRFAFHVRTLVNATRQTRGRHTIVWDGKDDQGNPAGPGVFICRMCTAGGLGASQLIDVPVS
jgi:photosystem II stability/assembly factor-like uncharacterized protein